MKTPGYLQLIDMWVPGPDLAPPAQDMASSPTPFQGWEDTPVSSYLKLLTDITDLSQPRKL